MGPLVQFAPKTLLITGRLKLLTVRTEVPEFVIVNVALALCPTVTFPNARFPLKPMMRVAEDAGDGDDGELDEPPLHAKAISEHTTTAARFIIGAREVSRGEPFLT